MLTIVFPGLFVYFQAVVSQSTRRFICKKANQEQVELPVPDLLFAK